MRPASNLFLTNATTIGNRSSTDPEQRSAFSCLLPSSHLFLSLFLSFSLICYGTEIDLTSLNRDIFLSRSEWCRCFAKSDRPCVAMRRRSKPGLLGAYKPSCDVEGFFQPTQCHIATATCWCVDKHGVEQSGSRIRGKPDCGKAFFCFYCCFFVLRDPLCV